MMKRLAWVAAIIGFLFQLPANASIVTYNDETSFQTALDSFTIVNLDAPVFDTFGSGYSLQDPGPQLVFAGLGITFQTNNVVVAGVDAYTVKIGRDRWIQNGVGFAGDLVVNFLSPVNGVGAWSNYIDGGRVRVFSGADLTGTLLGEAATSDGIGDGAFGGLISTDSIRSAQVTCDYNGDLKCGVYDIQYGSSSVPEPATFSLSAIGLIGFALFELRHGLPKAGRWN